MEVIEQQARTVALKCCAACNSGLLESDKFCRWCGELQPYAMIASAESPHLPPTAAALQPPAAYTTSNLTLGPREEVYRSISAPLVNAVVTGALAGPATGNQSRLIKRAILALIAIPVWLIIVLLSPLDAYAAVKNLAR